MSITTWLPIPVGKVVPDCEITAWYHFFKRRRASLHHIPLEKVRQGDMVDRLTNADIRTFLKTRGDIRGYGDCVMFGKGGDAGVALWRLS